jgi:hypothetical protein
MTAMKNKAKENRGIQMVSKAQTNIHSLLHKLKEKLNN